MTQEQPRWRFARMTPAEINQDPVQGEFFSRESDLPGRLVREAIQNSLDARRDGETVRVRFTFSGDRDALPPEKAARYLDGLEEHVEAVVEGGGMAHQSDEDDEGEAEAAYDALARFGAPMEYLVVEDFGTTGLAGDIGANSEREEGNDFWGFFRSIGISPKGEDAAGSWGLGKWVFPDASVINAYLGMTQRHGEDNWLLMGMALLKTHHIDDVKYRYYGSFAAHSDDDDNEWLPLPVEAQSDSDFILAALQDFRLKRLDDPGLSVIVPFPKSDLIPSAIARAVLTQYFLPILRGDLVVEVIHPDQGNRTIDGTTITDEVRHIASSERDDESPESLRGVIDLARWAIDQGEAVHIELPARNLADAMSNHAELATLRERYEAGERMAFRLTRDVRARNDTESAESSFRLYLERATSLSEGHDYFVRGNLRIPHMDHIRRQKARALVLVDEKSPLGHMLRDAEGPAHESWDPNAQRLKDNWSGGPQRVRDVRQAAVNLLQRLIERPAEQQMDALADLFPGDPSQIGRGRSRSSGGGTTDEGPRPPFEKPSELDIGEPRGAIVVKPPSHPPNGRTYTGTVWEARFAYDTVRGSPFTVFERSVKDGYPDFSLLNESLHVVPENCEMDADLREHNALRFTVTAEEFRLTISGFDERDLTVRLDEVRDEAVAEREDQEGAA